MSIETNPDSLKKNEEVYVESPDKYENLTGQTLLHNALSNLEASQKTEGPIQRKILRESIQMLYSAKSREGIPKYVAPILEVSLQSARDLLYSGLDDSDLVTEYILAQDGGIVGFNGLMEATYILNLLSSRESISPDIQKALPKLFENVQSKMGEQYRLDSKPPEFVNSIVTPLKTIIDPQQNGVEDNIEIRPIDIPPTPTQDTVLSELRLLADGRLSEFVGQSAPLIKRITLGSFTPYQYEELIKRVELDDIFISSFVKKPRDVESIKMLKEIVDRIKNPRDFQFFADMEVARKINPEAFNKMDEVIPDVSINEEVNILGESYKVTNLLGAGNYGKVYLAHSEKGGEVALKVSNPNLSEQEKLVFLSEKYTLIELEAYQSSQSHDNIVRTPKFICSGKTLSGEDYLAMTVASGIPLHKIKQFPLEKVAIVGEQACSVLEALHAFGKSNRDFQGVNFFWDESSEQINIIDWNLVSGGFSTNGEEKHEFSPQDDIYALGKHLLLLSGIRIDNELEINRKQVIENSNIDPELKLILQRSVDIEPSKRYQTIRDFRKDLEKITRQ